MRRNPQEIAESVAGETAARSLMLPNYNLFGLSIIDTNGNREQDLIGVGIVTSRKYRIEEKYRRVIFGDFLIELLQDVGTTTPDLGWYYKTRADLLAYIICDTDWCPQSAYIIHWPEFKVWWLEFLATLGKHPRGIISPKGIGLSLNLSIAWDIIPARLFKKRSFGPKAQTPF